MNKIGIGALTVVAALGYLCLWITDRVIWQGAAIEFSTLRLIRLGLLATAAALLLAAFFACVVRPKGRLLARRIWASLLTSALVLLVLEGAFMFVATSHNVGYTLAARVWHERHWHLNSLGYRDDEHVAEPGRRVVFAIGDSFTAGGGVARTEDRFSDRLAALRPDLQVLNLGQNGSDAVAAFRRLQQHPLAPDVVVLQYYLNDVEGTARRAGWSLPAFVPHHDLAPRLSFLVRNSFLLDFVYWRFPHADSRDYVRFLERAMRDADLCDRHLGELEKFAAYADETGTPLIVVVFPVLQDVEVGRPLAQHVMRLFEGRAAGIVDVAELIDDVDVPARIVNSHDAHPSVLVHALVAEALAEIVESI